MNKLMLFPMLLIFVFTVRIMPISAQDDTLTDVLNEFGNDENSAIVVQVTTNEDTYAAAGGLADGDRAATPEDRFRIGSMSKTFVATVTLMLVDEGVIDLDDPAANYLPTEIVERIANVDSVTIRQLLSMRSGIDDYLGTDEFWNVVYDDPNHDWTAAEALTYAYDLPALFAPDEGYSYSNTNYLLMQIILETVTGQPLHTLVRERILDPLNMNDTYTQVFETLPGEFVAGYEDFDGDGMLENVSAINDGAGLGDGALISTTGDLTIFYQALLQDQTLLSAASMDELLNFQDTGDGEGYSLGLDEWESDYGAAWGHSGGVLGFLSIGFYLPEEEAIIIVLSANSEIDPYEVAVITADAILE